MWACPVPGGLWVDGWVGDQHAGHVSEDHIGRNMSEASGRKDEWGSRKQSRVGS